jgi:multiple sugar transport system substrate-binding protein
VPADEYNINKELIEKFERQNPDIKVSYMNDPTKRSMDKLQTMFVAGTAPDVMSIHGAYFVPFASKGLLTPLDAFIKKDPGFGLAKFYPRLLDACKYNDKLYSLPRFSSVYILFYNKNLFDAQKLPYPDTSWTWNDYLNAAIKLTRDTNNDGIYEQYGCIIDFWGGRIYPWVWQNGGGTFDGKKNVCLLNQEKSIEAIQFLVDLRFKHKVTPFSVALESRSNVEMFRTGRAGMFMSGAWEIQNLRADKKIDWDIAPLPKKAKQATMLGTENYAIYSKTKYPEASWKLLKFLLSSEVQTIMSTKLDKQPSLIAVGNVYAKNNQGFHRKVLIDAMDYAIPPPNFRQWNRIESTMQDQLDLIWLGKKSVRDGLNDATTKINAILSEK